MLESFTNKYPDTSEVLAIILRKKTNSTAAEKSAIGVLATALTEEGAYGLRSQLKELTEREGIMMVPDYKTFLLLPERVKIDLRHNFAAIVLGISIGVVEDAMINRECDLSLWQGRYNLTVSGTIFPPLAIPIYDLQENLSGPQLRGLYGAVGRDKTFASLFGPDFRVLPGNLQRLLTKTEAVQSIRTDIIPIYRERAVFLVAY